MAHRGRGAMKTRPLGYVSVLFVLAALVAGCSMASLQERESAESAAKRAQVFDPGEYRIGPGDVLQISVWKNEELSRTVPVRPDGMISLPLLNEVRAAGLTPLQLRDELMKGLVLYTSGPEPGVSVIIREVHSFTVSVLGEVVTSGRYELRGRATVLDVIAEAGGFSEFASRSRIHILRRQGQAVRRIPFSYRKAVLAEGREENFFVEPGDIIIVP